MGADRPDFWLAAWATRRSGRPTSPSPPAAASWSTPSTRRRWPPAPRQRRPGPRPQYHPTYYGAFVLDPDGNNVEAVHHGG